MVYPATLSTFDSPKVAKPRLLSPARQGLSFFVKGGDILFGHMGTFLLAVFLIGLLNW
jgi:hypothetical protein